MWACASGAATPVQQVSFKTEERWQRQRQSLNPQVYFTSAITGMQAHTLWLDGWDTCSLWLVVLFFELKKKSRSKNKNKTGVTERNWGNILTTFIFHLFHHLYKNPDKKGHMKMTSLWNHTNIKENNVHTFDGDCLIKNWAACCAA